MSGWWQIERASIEESPASVQARLALRRPDTGEVVENAVTIGRDTTGRVPLDRQAAVAINLLRMWAEAVEHRLRCDRQEPGAEKFADHDGHCAGTRSFGTYDEPIRAAFAAAEGGHV